MKLPSSIGNFDDLTRHLQQVRTANRIGDRPFTAICYAQCIDGSIATRDRRPLAISGRASMTLTHRLRSVFGGILVGINTVLADNPQLTARLVNGPNPQPIVLDTHLRTPVASRLVQREDRSTWLASAVDHPTDRHAALTRAGVECLPCGLNGMGQIDLNALLRKLYTRGIHSLMVEGGARVITSFIQAGLADLFIITISPAFIGGLQVIDGGSTDPLAKLSLTDIHYERLDNDLIVWAKPRQSS